MLVMPALETTTEPPATDESNHDSGEGGESAASVAADRIEEEEREGLIAAQEAAESAVQEANATLAAAKGALTRSLDARDDAADVKSHKQRVRLATQMNEDKDEAARAITANERAKMTAGKATAPRASDKDASDLFGH